uniref:inorganic phosphate transporter n=1 Tax=Kineosporia sp. A_224 TaxID=1962180 RepID=UPI000B4A8917
MDLLLLAVVGVIAIALLFDFSNGFHDAANSVATVVATKVMPASWAVGFSAAANFAAFFFVGTAVADTVAKVVHPGTEGVAVVFAALVAAIGWNYATWFVGLPSSSSHAVIGGLVGAGIAAGGTGAVNWTTVGRTAAAIVASPAVALAVAALATVLVAGLQRLTGWADDAGPFKGLQLVSAAAVSFGHGANDAQKTMGVIAALLAGSGYLTVGADGTVPVPTWVALAAYGAIALGTVWGGWRIIETMGLRITTLSASTGAAANIGATTAIFGATQLGIPISTTHAAGSSIAGAGLGSRRRVDLRVLGGMAVAWVVTLPSTAAVGWLVYRLTQLAAPWDVLSVGTLLLALGAWIVWAMWHAEGARELETELATTPDAILDRPLT